MDNSNIEENINFKRIIQNILVNIYFVIGSSLLIFAFFLYLYISSERVWRITSLVEIDDSSSTLALDFTDALSSSSSVNLDEQMILYSSNTNIKKLVKELQLDIAVYLEDEHLRLNKLINFSTYDFSFNSVNSSDYFFYVSKSNFGFDLYDEDINLLSEDNQFGESVEVDGGSFTITSIDSDSETLFEIIFLNDMNVVQYYKDYFGLNAEIESSYSWDRGNLIRVSVNDSDIDFAKKILNTANKIYTDQDIEDNAKEADRSLRFIDEQISIARDDLQESEKKLNNFQKIYGTINVDLEIEGYIDEISMLNERIRSIRIKTVELESIYSKENIQLKSLQRQEDELVKQLDSLNKTIKELPETQQEYINLFGTVQINKLFYQELLSKKLEVSIIKASTLGNVKIIDEAYVSGKVTPSGSRFAMIVIVLSLAVGFLIIYARSYLFGVYSFPAALVEDHDFEFLGVVESFEELHETEQVEKFSSVSENLLMEMGKYENAKVIQVVGATPKVGKSTAARNIALYFSNLGRKTILIDLDFRRGDQHEYFKIKKLDDLKVYENPETHLNNFKQSDNLYVLPRKRKGAHDILPLSESNTMTSFMNHVKDKFDIVILDNPPSINIPDSISLSKYSDVVIAVVRHKVSKPRDIHTIEKMFKGVGKPINASIYNSFKPQFGDYYSDYYEYTYSYGYKYYDSDD